MNATMVKPSLYAYMQPNVSYITILYFCSLYRANARTNPPIIAREPVATWATAAFFDEVGVAPLVDEVVWPEEAVFVAMVVESVMFEVGLELVLEVFKVVLFAAGVELLV